MKNIAQDESIMSYLNPTCDLFTLVVEELRVWAKTYQCVLGFAPGECVNIPTNVYQWLIETANDLLDETPEPEENNLFPVDPIGEPEPVVVEPPTPEPPIVADSCEWIVCQRKTRTCAYGLNKSCTNTCNQWVCSDCSPSICDAPPPPPPSDPCEWVVCPRTTRTCAYGGNKSCANSCRQWSCSQCSPDVCESPPAQVIPEVVPPKSITQSDDAVAVIRKEPTKKETSVEPLPSSERSIQNNNGEKTWVEGKDVLQKLKAQENLDENEWPLWDDYLEQRLHELLGEEEGLVANEEREVREVSDETLSLADEMELEEQLSNFLEEEDQDLENAVSDSISKSDQLFTYQSDEWWLFDDLPEKVIENPSVLVEYDEQVEDSRLLEGTVYLRSDDEEKIDEVKKDLKKKFPDAIVDIRPLFPETNLIPDVIVEYNVDALRYQEIVAYLNTQQEYISYDTNTLTNTVLELHPWITFSVEAEYPDQDDDYPDDYREWDEKWSFTTQWLREWFDSISWFFWWLFWWWTEGGFSTQSYDEEQGQRHLSYLGFDEVKECASEWRPVKIAIVDNWFDTVHEDLDDKIVAWYDAADNDEDIQVPNYKKERNHGTKEAGLIWAEEWNEGEFADVMWIFPNSELILIKATKDTASGKEITNWIEAIAKAYEMWAEVINLSRWGFGNVPMLERVTKKVSKKWVKIVAAAWNYKKKDRFYPAAYEWVIGVAAVDQQGKKAKFSNYWSRVDIAAPWVDILTTDLGDNYDTFDGTSEASPLVAWALAMAISLWFDREDLKEHLVKVNDKNIWEWILDMRFLCSATPLSKQEADNTTEKEQKEHAVSASENRWGTPHFLMWLGLFLILLWVWWWVRDFMKPRD